MSCCNFLTSLILTRQEIPLEYRLMACFPNAFANFSSFSFSSRCLYSTYILLKISSIVLSTLSHVHLCPNKCALPLSMAPFNSRFLCSSMPSFGISTTSQLEDKNSQRCYFAWENIQWGFCCCWSSFNFWSSFHFWSLFCCCSSFTFAFRHHPSPFRGLSPGFYNQFILSAQPIAEWFVTLSFSTIPLSSYRERYGFERALFTCRCFLPCAPSPTFYLRLSKLPWELAALPWSLLCLILILKTHTRPVYLFDSQ